MNNLSNSMRHCLATVTLVLAATLSFSSMQNALAQDDHPVGTIRGSVTADRGEVRAIRVKARDEQHGITYAVYTTRGHYRFNALPTGSYTVEVFEEGYESPKHTVAVTEGETAHMDIALKSLAAPSASVELVDWDTLYPPGPARDLLVDGCLGCHGPAGYHRRPARSRDAWAATVELMFIGAGIYAGVGSPMVGEASVSKDEKDLIIDYLGANFGPGDPRREFKHPELVRDEEALENAIFIRYDVDPAASAPSRGTHDVFPSLELPGQVWVASIRSDELLRVNVSEPRLTVAERVHSIPIPVLPGKSGVGPHGIIEHNGRVYSTGISADHMAVADVKSATLIDQIPALTQGGGMHTSYADSKGNIWYTQVGQGKIGRIDAKTGEVTEWDPVPAANYYGVVVDSKDRVWVAGMSRRTLVMWDPQAEEWTRYTTPNNVRRLSIDSQDNVWLCEYFGNALTMLDPETGEFTRYPLPLPYGNPYEAFVDQNDNVWTDVDEYNSLVKLDPKTGKFTYFPYPDPNGHTPKIETDADGTLWFAYRQQLFAFRENGNEL